MVRLRCHVCEFSANYKWAIKAHESQAHPEIYPPEHGRKVEFSCEKCDKKHNSRVLLNRHVQTKHAGGAPRTAPCRNCSKTFARAGILTEHMKTCDSRMKDLAAKHAIRAYCEECDLQFAEVEELDAHYEEEHDAELAYCSDCHVCFKSSRSLWVHERDVHDSQEPPPWLSQADQELWPVNALAKQAAVGSASGPAAARSGTAEPNNNPDDSDEAAGQVPDIHDEPDAEDDDLDYAKYALFRLTPSPQTKSGDVHPLQEHGLYLPQPSSPSPPRSMESHQDLARHLYDSFVEQYDITINIAEFVNIAAYLYVLLRWGIGYEESVYDYFIAEWQKYLPRHGLSYHEHFSMRVASGEIGDGTILRFTDLEALAEQYAEAFKQMEEEMTVD